MLTRTNQKRVLIISLVISCLTLIIINYSNTNRITNYLNGSKDQFNEVTTRPDLKSGRICCLILTIPQNFLTRTRAVNDTWGPRCDRYFFVSEMPEANATPEQTEFQQRIPLLPIGNITTGRAHLTTKVTKALLFAYEHYLNDFDWFVKADDDTYLVVENLRKFLSKQDSTEPVTFGYNFKTKVPIGYHSGGASYVLSRAALQQFYNGHQVPNNRFCVKEGRVEDVDIATCLRQQGVRLGESLDEHGRETFHPLSFGKHFSGAVPEWLRRYASNPIRPLYDCCSERTISFHYMSSMELYHFDFLLYRMRVGR